MLAAEPVAVLTHVLNHFGIKKCVLLGHDWGGGIAYEYAVQQPQRVLGVIGYSISYRASEVQLSKLKHQFCSKKRLLLCWIESEVHLKKKGLALAKGLGVKLKECRSEADVERHVHAFLRGLASK